MARGVGDVWVKNLGSRRNAPRIFFDGLQAVRTRFAPGDKFEVRVGESRVTLKKKIDGSHTVSRRLGSDGDLPVIDINSKELLGQFEGMESVRVLIEGDSIHLLPMASEVNRRARMDRLRAKMAAGAGLAMGSLSHGGGVLSHAIHHGLERAGIRSSLRFANEIRDDLLLQAARHNSAWSADTRAIGLPMQELAQDEWLLDTLPKLEVLEVGIPCSGASRAGISKKGLTKMEDHEQVGHLVHAALVILQKTQASIFVVECVPGYAQSASAQIMRHQLRDMGYDVHEAILDGADFGCLEARRRWCMVAVTRGMRFDFREIHPEQKVVRRLSDFLDPTIGPDDPRWRSFSGLFAKADRDRADGKGFKIQEISPGNDSIPTLRKGYFKAGTTDPLLIHPDDSARHRLLTAGEHANIKGVPREVIDGLSETQAHQLLGQGIVYAVFEAVGWRLGEHLAEFSLERMSSRLRDVEAEGLDCEVSARRDRPAG